MYAHQHAAKPSRHSRQQPTTTSFSRAIYRVWCFAMGRTHAHRTWHSTSSYLVAAAAAPVPRARLAPPFWRPCPPPRSSQVTKLATNLSLIKRQHITHTPRGADNRQRPEQGQNRTEPSTEALSRTEAGRNSSMGRQGRQWGPHPGQGEGGRDTCGGGRGAAGRRARPAGDDQATGMPAYAYILSQATSHPSKRGHTWGRARHSRHESRGDMRIRTGG